MSFGPHAPPRVASAVVAVVVVAVVLVIVGSLVAFVDKNIYLDIWIFQNLAWKSETAETVVGGVPYLAKDVARKSSTHERSSSQRKRCRPSQAYPLSVRGRGNFLHRPLRLRNIDVLLVACGVASVPVAAFAVEATATSTAVMVMVRARHPR